MQRIIPDVFGPNNLIQQEIATRQELLHRSWLNCTWSPHSSQLELKPTADKNFLQTLLFHAESICVACVFPWKRKLATIFPRELQNDEKIKLTKVIRVSAPNPVKDLALPTIGPCSKATLRFGSRVNVRHNRSTTDTSHCIFFLATFPIFLYLHIGTPWSIFATKQGHQSILLFPIQLSSSVEKRAVAIEL